MKDEDIEVLEKVNRIREKRAEIKWERRYNKLKIQLTILGIALILPWIVLILILIGIL